MRRYLSRRRLFFFPSTSRRRHRPPRVHFFLAGHSSSLLPYAFFLSRHFGFYDRPPRKDINKRSLGGHKSHKKKFFCSWGATEGFAPSWSGGVRGLFSGACEGACEGVGEVWESKLIYYFYVSLDNCGLLKFNSAQITQIFLLPPSFLTFNIPRASPTDSIFYYPAMICRLPSVILALLLWLPEEKQWNGVIIPASSLSFLEEKIIFQIQRAELSISY